MENRADIGIAGLAVMGANLALNLESNGCCVALWNRTGKKIDNFMADRGKGKNFLPYRDIPSFLKSLKKPRKILMLLKAGTAIDDFIGLLAPHFEPGDILIDGGNSHFRDTLRRAEMLKKAGVSYAGVGISGGEEGALKGPSLMIGADPDVWPHLHDIFHSIAAKAGKKHESCCALLGPVGAGHFVKMIHNGIEYALLQMLAEVYALFRDALEMTPAEMSAVFARWNKTPGLNGYLTGIAAEVLKKKDPRTGNFMVDMILDSAGQKGTGKWSTASALELGTAAPSIADAVFTRDLSVRTEERAAAARSLPRKKPEIPGNRAAFAEQLRQALLASEICAFAQGFTLMAAASDEYQWNLDLARIAAIWRGGCIIQTAFLENIMDAFQRDPRLENLILDLHFRTVLSRSDAAWREAIAAAVRASIAVPALSSALAWYDTCRTERLPANFIQALRDYFGAHQFERIDSPRGEFFHLRWRSAPECEMPPDSGSVPASGSNAGI